MNRRTFQERQARWERQLKRRPRPAYTVYRHSKPAYTRKAVRPAHETIEMFVWSAIVITILLLAATQ